MWRDRFPTLDPGHHVELESRAAIRELADGVPPRQAEEQAHEEYVRQHLTRAASHHLAGVRAAHVVGDMEEAARHSLRYGVMARALGYDPQGEPPPEVAALARDPEHTKIYGFKPHDADAMLLNHLIARRGLRKAEDEDEDDETAHLNAGRLGVHPTSGEVNSPSVHWEAQDLHDSGPATAETVGRTYAPKGRVPKHRQVYPAMVPVEDVPSPQLAEEQQEPDPEFGPAEYDWDEIDRGARGRGYPPAKLYRDRAGRVSIIDGNHRITRWQDQHSHIPAWVIDDYKRPAIKKSEDNAASPIAGALVRDEGGTQTWDLSHLLPRMRQDASERLLVCEGPTGRTAHHLRDEAGRQVPLAALAEAEGGPADIAGGRAADDVRRAADLGFRLRRAAQAASIADRVRQAAQRLEVAG